MSNFIPFILPSTNYRTGNQKDFKAAIKESVEGRNFVLLAYRCMTGHGFGRNTQIRTQTFIGLYSTESDHQLNTKTHTVAAPVKTRYFYQLGW